MSKQFLVIISIILVATLGFANPPSIKKYQTLDELQNLDFGAIELPQELKELKNQVYLDISQIDVCWKLLEGFDEEIILEITDKDDDVHSVIIDDYETTEDGNTIYLYNMENDTWYWFSEKYNTIEQEYRDKGMS